MTAPALAHGWLSRFRRHCSAAGAMRSMVLRRGELRREDCAERARITCVSGTLWITFEGDRKDYLLGAGQSLDTAGRRHTLVSALEAAELRIEEQGS